MAEMKYVFGPVPSRRLGNSLGISPIPKKACNYSCIYCQLGRTDKMTNQRQEYFKLEDILAEFELCLKDQDKFDIVTVVGEGEPTLYSRLGELIAALKARTTKPVAVITNSALMYDPQVRSDLMKADIVLPSLDSYDAETFRKVDRPYGSLDFEAIYQGLVQFSQEYTGQLWMEIMLVRDINDSDFALEQFKKLLSASRYDRVYINTPVRPPAESFVQVCTPETIEKAVALLGGISIDMLSSGSFFSEIPDDYEAILSIIGRHPMNQFEVTSFLSSRGNCDTQSIFARLAADPKVERVEYKGFYTYRLR